MKRGRKTPAFACKGDVFTFLMKWGLQVPEAEAKAFQRAYQREQRKAQLLLRQTVLDYNDDLPPCYYCQRQVLMYCAQHGTHCVEFDLYTTSGKIIDEARASAPDKRPAPPGSRKEFPI